MIEGASSSFLYVMCLHGILSMTGVMGILAGEDRIIYRRDKDCPFGSLPGEILNYLNKIGGGSVRVFCLTEGALIH
jgi:hypothetical protein